MNYGLGWSYEPNALSHDLTKPALLTPILGLDGLNPPAARTRNFSPTSASRGPLPRDGKTVVRGGAGRYFDPAASTNAVNLINERHLLSPLGTGNLTRTGANIFYEGRALEFLQADARSPAHRCWRSFPRIRAELQRSINPGNRDFSLRNIDAHEGRARISTTRPMRRLYAVHVSLGVQRELARGLVVSADVAWKRFVHTFINGIDYNRWLSAGGPRHSEVHRRAGPGCSCGLLQRPDVFRHDDRPGPLPGVAGPRRKAFLPRLAVSGLLCARQLRRNQRHGDRDVRNPGGRVFGFNNDNWFENDGPLPTDQRHILNLSGFVELPWRLQIAASVCGVQRAAVRALRRGH